MMIRIQICQHTILPFHKVQAKQPQWPKQNRSCQRKGDTAISSPFVRLSIVGTKMLRSHRSTEMYINDIYYDNCYDARLSELLLETRTKWLPMLPPTSAMNKSSQLVDSPTHAIHKRPCQRSTPRQRLCQRSRHAITSNYVYDKGGNHDTIGLLSKKKKEKKTVKWRSSTFQKVSMNFVCTYNFHINKSFRLTLTMDANWIGCLASMTNSIHPNSQTPNSPSK